MAAAPNHLERLRLSARTAALRGTDLIRLGIALLAVFAFALSYDALRQMGVAIHIRGLLTYAFPLVIDGFIAVGVGALLMLRTAPWYSRLYVWLLVGAATVTSIWANATHAVRLNQQAHHGNGLRLDDLTVGGLSAIAPLALAGAVHLYIVVHHHPAPEPHDPQATDSSEAPAPPRADLERVTSGVPGGAHLDVRKPTGTEVADHADDVAPATGLVARSAEPQQPEPDDVDPERLALARSAPLGRQGRASRRHIEDTFRDGGLTIGRKEADGLKDLVQAELDDAEQRADRAVSADAV
ncbi:DUF2637 domain-containing protein [Streptomyces sp. NPDC051569]|uniref:DUF2637 domain-containing protein n=1 Tax=Streptomyces sp. NPDC051569 TaxID=3365661 RepID=UPI0037885BE0